MTRMEVHCRRVLHCRACPGMNIKGRTEAAPIYGNPKSPILLVGQSNHSFNFETPDRQIPFLNASSKRHAGDILFPAIKNAGLRYVDLCTTNVVRCHPLHNRTVAPQEIKACRKWLIKELLLVKPKLVICLGNVAGEALDIPTKYRVSSACIKLKSGKQIRYWGSLLPHPAYLLRMQDSEPERAEAEIAAFNGYFKWLVERFYHET